MTGCLPPTHGLRIAHLADQVAAELRGRTGLTPTTELETALAVGRAYTRAEFYSALASLRVERRAGRWLDPQRPGSLLWWHIPRPLDVTTAMAVARIQRCMEKGQS